MTPIGLEGKRGRGEEGKRGRGAEGKRGGGEEGKRGRGADGFPILNANQRPATMSVAWERNSADAFADAGPYWIVVPTGEGKVIDYIDCG